MKQLSQLAEEERQSTGNSIYWILEIDWPDETRSYSSRALQLGEHTYQAWLLDAGALRLELARHFEQTTGVVDRVSVVVSNVVDAGEGLAALLERYDPALLQEAWGEFTCWDDDRFDSSQLSE